jgi:hypothetical protein
MNEEYLSPLQNPNTLKTLKKTIFKTNQILIITSYFHEYLSPIQQNPNHHLYITITESSQKAIN